MEALLLSLPSSMGLVLPLLLLLLVQLASMATCHEEMKSIYVGQRVLPVRLGRPAFGPESLAFDHRGDGPYTGVSNGRILRWRGAQRGWTEFAHNHKHETVAMCAAKKRLVVPESACGRPLGLQFHEASGDLYYGDAYLGLMRVGRRGGLAEAVATEAGGAPLNFVNAVEVDQETGHVYFTDSSATYQRSPRRARDSRQCHAMGSSPRRAWGHWPRRPRLLAARRMGQAGRAAPPADGHAAPRDAGSGAPKSTLSMVKSAPTTWVLGGGRRGSICAVNCMGSESEGGSMVGCEEEDVSQENVCT